MPLIRARPKADHGYLLRLSSILEARKEWGRFPTSGLSQTEKETSLWF